ncbi:MAG TPA: hypothetical protein VK503_02150 [Candidatus Bathyarchaeia archaeon]|nr:hypothetical protein [Candidatus Bathyarchaeia archaeon]
MTTVYVYLWFDIEDYVTRETDDLPLIALKILEKYKVPATCKMVAEKVRELEENGRNDVISAIGRFDVGFHTNTHSQHPTLYEYVANLDLLSGAEEFVAREKVGVEKIEQTFSRHPSCFGHGGPTWAPHVYPALAKLKIPIYLDETSILNVNNQPYWYCGVLNLNGANKNCIRFDYTFEREDGLRVLKRKFKSIHDRLERNGGGAVSVLYHLHTFINKKYWDKINFANGKNTPKTEYKRPPAQPLEITQRAWQNFEEFVRYMRSFESVRFITATNAIKIYRQSCLRLDSTQLRQVATHFRNSSDYMRLQDTFMSPAEAFYTITKAIVNCNETTIGPVEVKEPLGPMAPFRSVGKRSLRTIDFIAAARITLEWINCKNYLPTSIKVGDYAELNPQDFLATACRMLLLARSEKSLPKEIIKSTGKLPNQKYIHPAKFRKACRWIVLPTGFKAPKILEQINLQAWTLKPAMHD